MRHLLIAGVLAVGAGASTTWAEAPDTASTDTTAVDSAEARLARWLVHPQKRARAVRAVVAPVIDGILDDVAWDLAPVQSGFTQRDPDQGESMTEATEFRILFDDEALYIGAMLYDSEPDSIMARLARRDDWKQRDEFNINIDPHHDHMTGNFFVVGPSGWTGDGVIWNDGWDDDSWDGVWEAETAILANGWSCELRIPYHVLRFSPDEHYTWGINAMRSIGRRNEYGQWVYIPRDVDGWNSRFGHLDGIEGIEPPRSLEIFPFGLGRTTLSPGTDGEPDATDLLATFGADLRYGLTSSISLNATVNPDFGQVEADPAVLNLSVFESFFRERRPFFLEGNSIYQIPGPGIPGIDRQARLFHSRRIGRQPSRFDLPDDADEVDRPDNTTILGAVKVSGKTENRTAFGVLDAVTGPENARIDQRLTDAQSGLPDTVRRLHRIEPLTNYFVGRVQQDLLTNSTVGAQLTAVNGEDYDPAYVGAVDGHIKWWDNAYRLFRRAAVSHAGQDDDRGSGYETSLYFSKFSGWLGGQLYVDARSPGFDVNDLGFMNRNDRLQAGAHLQVEKLEPYWFARKSGFNFNAWQNWNYDGDLLRRGIGYNMWHDLHNYWGFWTGLEYEFEAFDDLGTRGGPVMVQPSHVWWGMDIWTDGRGPVSGWLGTNLSYGQGGDNRRQWLGVEVEMRPASNIELEIEPGLNYRKSFAQWVENVDDDGDDEDDHFVFGELENRVFEIGARGTYAFTPELSLQLFLQPFVTVGDYTTIKELVRPRSYEFTLYDGLDDNPDFHRRSLRFNLVMRWEYAPGSTLFVVWQQNRDRDFDDTRDPDFDPLGGVGRAFTDDGDNIFLVKCNRWFGM